MRVLFSLRCTLPLGAVLLGAALVAGCDASDPGAFTEEVVVSGTLVAGEPYGPVEVSLSRPIGERFDPAEARVANALMTVSLLDASGSVESTTPYAYEGGQNPIYKPAEAPPVVLAGRTYRLDVVVPGTPERRLTAQTTVPEAVEVVEPPPERATYLEPQQGPSVLITESSQAERRAVFLFSVRSTQPARFAEVQIDGETRFESDPESGFPLVPSRIVFADCEPRDTGALVCEEDPSDFVQGSSPLLNQDSYESLGDGSLRVNVPWLAFGFYGPTELTLASVDDAILAFFETQAVQFAPTTLSPGEIPNIVSNVEGGLGFFGSIARVTTTIFIEPGAEASF